MFAYYEDSRASAGCTVYEEHRKVRIERERERTNQREGQKYDSYLAVRRGKCDAHTEDVAESVV